MFIKQFRHDLARGLGSIILYLKQSPKLTNNHIDAIYDACIKNTAYDPQCDVSREDYLWEVIQLSKASNSLQERILKTLESIDGWDLFQVYRLAKIFVLNGNPTALEAMKRRFRYHEEWYSFIGGEEIIEAEGEQGFLFVAGQIGKEILSSDYEEDKYLLEFAYEHLGEDKVAALLENLCDVNIQAFLQSADQHQGYSQSTPNLAVSYDDLKTSIGSAPKPLYRFLKWGKHATEEDLLRAANDLLEERNSKKLEAYLYMFGKTVFPLDPQRIIELAQSKNSRLRSAAIRTLSNLKDERIHQLAIQLISRQVTEIDALDLFIHNYTENDLELLERVFFKKRNKDLFHGIGCSILDIFTHNPTPSCQKVLTELYKRGLCTYCRKHCVEVMIFNHVLPLTIQNEIKYDCNSAIRDLL